ncbi:MAG: cytochrome c3 family protein [Deltaproteobacteria bacterium]|nr:cytochrome c3 family protein [Deltaproteobacteria bacterium]
MDRKVISIVAAILFFGSLFVLQGVFGQPDSITIDNPGLHATDKYQGVQFGHKKHADAVKDCKKCHHTYKEGGKAQKCTGCHTKDSKIDAKKAFHANCRGCHRALKKEGKATGPTACTKCHAKK